MWRQNERSQRHAVILLVVLRIVGGNQELVRVDGRPHGLADLARELERRKESHVVQIESYLPRLDGIVNLGLHSISCGQFQKQAANVSAVMEGGSPIPGFEVNFTGIRQANR